MFWNPNVKPAAPFDHFLVQSLKHTLFVARASIFSQYQKRLEGWKVLIDVWGEGVILLRHLDRVVDVVPNVLFIVSTGA